MSVIYDISPVLSNKTPVWPGDTPLSRSVLLSIGNGANIDLSTLNSTVHIGAHADAPSHYLVDGADIANVPLEPYIGECCVIFVPNQKAIGPEHLQIVAKNKSSRVIIRTDSFDHNGPFDKDFTYLKPTTVAFLAELGVCLIGIDTPSFDAFDSKDLPSHQELGKRKIYNIEGLYLSGIEPGIYEFIGLPLKLKGFDASPIRAILRSR